MVIKKLYAPALVVLLAASCSALRWSPMMMANKMAAHPVDGGIGAWDDSVVEMFDLPEQYVPSLNVTFVGVTMNSTQKNRPINSFLGIKFGHYEKRFQHSTVWDNYTASDEGKVRATNMGPFCVQNSWIGDFSSGDCECLYLNVFVPRIENPKDLPVMVFIHGGSFTSGGANLYLPNRLLDEDVILVVIQYRLGAFGWFSLLNDDAPGNAGLSDQIAALKWVQKHIAGFGGNPDMVTIFGQSAGSASVSMLQTLNVTKGLYSGVIAESGSALEYWAIDKSPISSASILANECKCNATDSADEIYDCLMEKSDYELSLCTYHMVKNQRMAGYMGFEGTAPVVQPDTVSTEYRLITDEPEVLIKEGWANDVPVMMGANRDEGSFVFGIMYSYYLVPNELLDDSEYIANDCIADILESFGVQDQTRTLSKLIQAEYFPDVTEATFEAVTPGMIDLTGTLFIKAGTYQTALSHSQYYESDTYFYSFDFISNNSLFDFMFATEDEVPFDAGVTHADELMYIFTLPSDGTESQMLTSKKLVTLWTNFAKHRDPTPDEDPAWVELNIEKWQKLTREEPYYLLIQDDVTLEMDYTRRWHVRSDLIKYNGTTPDPGITPTEPGPIEVTPEDYESIKQQREDFLIVMIVFIIAFVVADACAIYYYFKAR